MLAYTLVQTLNMSAIQMSSYKELIFTSKLRPEKAGLMPMQKSKAQISRVSAQADQYI